MNQAVSRDFDFILPWQPFGRRLQVPWIAAALVTALTFALYLYTLAPNVTLEDSGEYITAAVTLGVTHPPGYPTWTTLTHLLVTLLPIGNVAWRVNLFSAICGSIANGLVAWLVANSTRWLLDQGDRAHETEAALPPWLLPFLGAVTAGLCLGCSEVMWSQSVIVEVYSLNAIFLVGTVTLFYRWAVDPQDLDKLLAAIVLFALGLTNHHTLLFILPVFLLGVWLMRRDFFPTFCVGVLLLSLSALSVLVWFSDDPVLQIVTQRLAFFLLTVILGITLSQIGSGGWNRNRFLGWGLAGLVLCRLVVHHFGDWFSLDTVNGWLLTGLITLLFGVIGISRLDRGFLSRMLILCWLCLSVYSLERVYSSTNPPMNWSYARLPGGFFHSVPRGQYSNSLGNLITAHFGPWLGVPTAPLAPAAPVPGSGPATPDALTNILHAATSYFDGLEENFSLALCLIAFLSLFLFGQLSRERRRWLWFLLATFLMLSFFMAIIDPAPSWDIATWTVRRRFFLPAHCIFALCLGYGVAGGLLAWRRYSREVPLWVFGLAPLLALLPLTANYATSTQRNHWFGWQYGTDMLRPLDKDAVVFGGTDPGRFVPTYMIFCESTQPARWKHDPTFDRSDLYLITQNALGDYYYYRYLVDQYDTERRQKTFSPFERWLGRDKAYPKDGLVFPTEEEFAKVFTDFEEKQKQSAANGQPPVTDGTEQVFELNGEIARFLFEKNKAKHSFYIEESLPINWMYPYLTPAGLIMKINPEPVPALTPEMIAQDRAFWDDYTAKLLATPGFSDDADARNSFAKLRNSIGNLYVFRKLNDEAVYAYRQALQLSPDMPETVGRLAALYAGMGRMNDAEQLANEAIQHDPNDLSFQQLVERLQLNREVDAQEKIYRDALAQNPTQLDPYRKLIALLVAKNDIPGIADTLKAATARFLVPTDELANYLRPLVLVGNFDAAEAALQNQLKLKPNDPILTYQLATVYAVAKRPELAFPLLAQAVASGRPLGIDLAGTVPQDSSWDNYRNDPRLQKAIGAPATNAAAPTPPPKK